LVDSLILSRILRSLFAMSSKAKETKNQTKNDKSSKVSQPPEEEEEVWDLIRVVPESDDCVCRTEGCQKQAVATWASNVEPADKWDMCEPCQELDFGGWPDGVVHSDEPPQGDASTTEVPHVSQTQDDPSASSSNETTTQGSETAAAPMPLDTSSSSTNKTATASSTEASVPEPTADTTTDEVSNETTLKEEEPQEVWDLKKILSFDDLNKDATIKCSTDDCLLPACCVWISNIAPTTKWYSCLDCQGRDFGGWPPEEEMPLKYMDANHLQVIGTMCSKSKNPAMPSLPTTTTSPSSSSSSSSQLNEKNSTHFVTPPPNSLVPSKNKAAAAKGKKITPATARAKPNPKALAIHNKWQAAAEAIGGKDARIVVSKPTAKKLIFDVMFDAFRPMNITQIYKVSQRFELGKVYNCDSVEYCTDTWFLFAFSYYARI
jgi:hypothetical protein